MGIAAGCTQTGICTVKGMRGLGQELTALDSVLALLVGSPAGVPTPTTGGGASQSSKPKSAACRQGDRWRGGIVMALLVAWVLVVIL